MKEVINIYKNIFIDLFKNKKYLIPVLLVAVLSYGFTITNYSIGMDDLCFDRYVQDTYILSAKRWATWGIYNLLHIVRFSPFWLDFIVATLMVLTATLICASIKRVLKDKASIWAYTILATVFLSNPMICEFFAFQSTNLVIVISNMLVIISAIIIFENYFNVKNKWYYLIPAIFLIIAISMYESCVQTYMVMLFIFALLKVMVDNIGIKEIFKLLGIGIVGLEAGIIGYCVMGEISLTILENMNILKTDFAIHNIRWREKVFVDADISAKLKIIYDELILYLFNGIKNYLPVTIFATTSLGAVLLGIGQSAKNKRFIYILLVLGIIAVNFALIVLQGYIIYRTQFSWFITTAFLCMYIFIFLNKNKVTKYLISAVCVLLIIIQSNSLNNEFYNEYRRFEKEKFIANVMALDIKKCDNYQEKPIICIMPEQIINPFINIPKLGERLVLEWGVQAFDERNTETIKFINNLGYNFKIASYKESKGAIKDNKELIQENIDKCIIELDNYIILNVSRYLVESK